MIYISKCCREAELLVARRHNHPLLRKKSGCIILNRLRACSKFAGVEAGVQVEFPMNQFDELKTAASRGSNPESRADSLLTKFTDIIATNKNDPSKLSEIVGHLKSNHMHLAKTIAGHQA